MPAPAARGQAKALESSRIGPCVCTCWTGEETKSKGLRTPPKQTDRLGCWPSASSEADLRRIGCFVRLESWGAGRCAGELRSPPREPARGPTRNARPSALAPLRSDSTFAFLFLESPRGQAARAASAGAPDQRAWALPLHPQGDSGICRTHLTSGYWITGGASNVRAKKTKRLPVGPSDLTAPAGLMARLPLPSVTPSEQPTRLDCSRLSVVPVPR